ncbi:unnamed protein product [Caenorhabditis angaria]|uniref:MATH domain-containing protein n=1 Tax=Caenorhabditis angaria TaxID=860376 RepID=A0A9P1J049_9PELO|nr:unnamed protein product [Caenorhabditis angaria]
MSFNKFDIHGVWDLSGLGFRGATSEVSDVQKMGEHKWRLCVNQESNNVFEFKIVQDTPEVPNRTWIFYFEIKLAVQTTREQVFRYKRNLVIDPRKCEGPIMFWNCERGYIESVTYDMTCSLYEFKDPAHCEETGLHLFKVGDLEFMVSKQTAIKKVSEFKKKFKNADHLEMEADPYDGLYFMTMVCGPANFAEKLLNDKNIDKLIDLSVDLGAKSVAKLCEKYMIDNGEDWFFTRKLYMADKLGSLRFLNRAISSVDYLSSSYLASILRDPKAGSLKHRTQVEMGKKIYALVQQERSSR